LAKKAKIEAGSDEQLAANKETLAPEAKAKKRTVKLTAVAEVPFTETFLEESDAKLEASLNVTPADHIGSLNDKLVIRGARVHNLKGIDIDIPREQLVVITGISGSGKSSLAFDTIYAEGQRRYVESLSPYARQFLDLMERPDVDFIEGLSPAISIEQKTIGNTPRSTVGTVTEIYDFIRLLFARLGTQFCVECNTPVTKQTQDQILDALIKNPEGTKLTILAPLVRGRKGHYKELFRDVTQQGYTRVRVDGELKEIEPDMQLDRYKLHTIEVVVDRIVLAEAIRPRLHGRMKNRSRIPLALIRR
jgi:excinuclease ABC subunit A